MPVTRRSADDINTPTPGDDDDQTTSERTQLAIRIEWESKRGHTNWLKDFDKSLGGFGNASILECVRWHQAVKLQLATTEPMYQILKGDLTRQPIELDVFHMSATEYDYANTVATQDMLTTMTPASNGL